MSYQFTVLMVYFSDTINAYAAQNWITFSKQQYFDSKGIFISIVFSMPILINCMLLIVSKIMHLLLNFYRFLNLINLSQSGKLVVPIHSIVE
jgi:hypothetical protein